MKVPTLTSTIAILMAAPLVLGYEVDLFSGSDCGGSEPYRLNVWDNTCATPPFTWRSMRVVTHGGGRQGGFFYRDAACHILARVTPEGGYDLLPGGGLWVDGGGWYFDVGRCINFPEEIKAAGSEHIA